jgi:hypothetical protein
MSLPTITPQEAATMIPWPKIVAMYPNEVRHPEQCIVKLQGKSYGVIDTILGTGTPCLNNFPLTTNVRNYKAFVRTSSDTATHHFGFRLKKMLPDIQVPTLPTL